MKTSIWHGCYDENLKTLITPESFSHPAKMAKRLCERIFEYGATQGYWHPGDVIVDPFGGIGTTGLIGGYRGYRVVMVELEPRFIELSRANIELNRKKLEQLGKPLPWVVQGDARRLAQIIDEAIGSIFSPPYADGSAHTGGDDPHPDRMTGGTLHVIGLHGAISSPPYVSGGHHPDQTGAWGGQAQALTKEQAKYGQQDGQIGRLNEGDIDQVVGAISSPPYADGGASEITGVDDTPARRQSTKKSRPKRERGYSFAGSITSPPWKNGLSNDRVDPEERIRLAREMGVSNAEHISAIDMEKIGKRPKGYVSGSVTSPPYEESIHDGNGIDASKLTGNVAGLHSQAFAEGYGIAEGQIGAESGETYWQAMAQVYSQLYTVLKPGGVSAIVVKDFVRNKQIVPLCDMTAQLLEKVGFTIIERTKAMLVKEVDHGQDMFGVHVTKRTERKSFFRRLAESKGSPRIDYEEVLWAQKPDVSTETPPIEHPL